MEPKKHEAWAGHWLDEVEEFIAAWSDDPLSRELDELRPVFRPEAADEARERLGPLDG